MRERDLAAKGYSVLTRSDEAGVGLFAKDNNSLFLFVQGHPEYEAETLLREYRRDIGRYLRQRAHDLSGTAARTISMPAPAIASRPIASAR